MNRKTLFIATAVALVVAFVGGAVVYNSASVGGQGAAAVAHPEVFSRDHAPSLGAPAAKVVITEFLDPACGTCAQFFPMVKKLMAASPGKVRLVTRHIPLHEGAADVVLALEASRKQGLYWQVLETLLASQDRWVTNHVASAERALAVLAEGGIDVAKLRADMADPEVARRVALDRADAQAVGVRATPEYFVNGQPLPSFGFQQLADLVDKALAAAN